MPREDIRMSRSMLDKGVEDEVANGLYTGMQLITLEQMFT